ncbi:MraY family glycosyltransferase [Streptomyces sp. NPDC090306]|uniref:MraY family glycosyltransferase n=1 Tax=Streptomyces sp. NPDC090306 TaxID=3365961 RepID=UPI003814F71F
MIYGIVAATTALLLAAVLAALFRRPALRLGLVERGRGDRGRGRPVPLLGGAAVVLATGAVAAAGEWTGLAPLGGDTGRLLVAAGGVALLGLVADVRRVKTRFVLAGTAVAAFCAVPYGETGIGPGLLAAVWTALVTVAFRSLDHADGLAGTVGVVTAFGVAACAAAGAMDAPAVLLSVLAAALAGFLMHNWHPARSALGSCGSLFTGFVLAGAAVGVRGGHGVLSSAGVLFALTAVASADAALVLLSRRLAGRPVARRSADHLAHRLRKLGLTAHGSVVVVGTGAFCGVLVGVLVHVGSAGATAAAGVAAVVPAGVLGLLRVPVYGPRRASGGGVAAGAVPTAGRAPRAHPAEGVRAPSGRRNSAVRPPRGPVSSQVRASLRVRNG